ncbi:MAG: cobalt ECF transporter T component CbiQ [Anaerolineaceae bacterium]|nr:cobalt ECF transporter T component CbiQ [Anaerolineaceae bacterium]
MVCETYFKGESFMHRLDPRVKLVAAGAFCMVLALSHRAEVLVAGLVLGIGLALVARLPPANLLKRMAAVNAFVLMTALLLPWTTPGRSLLEVGPLAFSVEGLAMAGLIALKSNAIVLAVTALLSTVEITRLGHALVHLKVPEKLAHLLLFSVRYIDLLHHEYRRLATAMKVRSFRPRMNLHTYQSLGNLVGMLLVRSFDRSQRIMAAMKCRGFRGRFYVLDHFSIRRQDIAFAVGSLMIVATLIVMEWL